MTKIDEIRRELRTLDREIRDLVHSLNQAVSNRMFAQHNLDAALEREAQEQTSATPAQGAAAAAGR